jgi:ATP-dependent Zn protease
LAVGARREALSKAKVRGGLNRRRDYSEATAARIDQEVSRLHQETHEGVRRCLTDSRARLDRLADAQLKEETVSGDELNRILGPRPALELEPNEKIAICHASAPALAS